MSYVLPPKIQTPASVRLDIETQQLLTQLARTAARSRMLTRRRVLLGIGAGVFGASFVAQGQVAPGKIWKIGFLATGTAAGSAQPVDALRGGLKDFGYIEGKNILIEYRWADGALERLPQLASELLREKADISVTYGIVGVRAAQRATTTVPIIIASLGVDPIAQGFAKSLARPGGNITGTLSFGVLLIRSRWSSSRILCRRLPTACWRARTG